MERRRLAGRVSRLDALAAASFSVPEDVCPDTTLLLRAPDGTRRELRVPYFVDLGPNSGYIGELPVQMVDAGRWLLTGIRSGSGSAAAEPPRQFWVLQKVVVSLDHLPFVAAGAVVPVTGRLVVYTPRRRPDFHCRSPRRTDDDQLRRL